MSARVAESAKMRGAFGAGCGSGFPSLSGLITGSRSFRRNMAAGENGGVNMIWSPLWILTGS